MKNMYFVLRSWWLLTNSAIAKGWGLWWTRAYTTCRAANCNSSFQIDHIYPFLSILAKTTFPGRSTRIRLDTSLCSPTTCASSLGIAQEVVPEVQGCLVLSSSTCRWMRSSRFPLPAHCNKCKKNNNNNNHPLSNSFSILVNDNNVYILQSFNEFDTIIFGRFGYEIVYVKIEFIHPALNGRRLRKLYQSYVYVNMCTESVAHTQSY